MVLIKEIEVALKPDSSEVRAQEDEILADSVLELANTDFTHLNEYETVAPGSIRKHVEADMRVAYPGKPTSRKRVFNPQLKEVPVEENTITYKDDHVNSISSSESIDDDRNSLSEGAELKSESEVHSSSDEEMTGSSDSVVEFDSDLDGSILPNEKAPETSDPTTDEEERNEEMNKGFDIFSSRTRNLKADIGKGKSIRNQLTLWEKLIECRIKLQPTLLNANKLYQKDSLKDFTSSLNSQEEESVTEAYSTLGNLMKVLLELQENLLNLAPEYRQLKSQKRKLNDNIIESEQHRSKKSKKAGNDLLEELHDDFKMFRNNTIQKWNEKTRVSSGKVNKNDFSAFDLPTLKQIEEILLDRERLLKRTRTKRSDYNILSKEKNTVAESMASDVGTKDNSNDCYPEIFDDDDFYHKLLRDFIEKKTSDVTDVSKRGKQWLELQKLRSRMKSKVDTRASKGRKLRFTVHNKMVNFMAPVPSFTWTNEARNELFKSLFH